MSNEQSFHMASGAEQIALIRSVTGNCVKRFGKMESISSELNEIIIGIPEASVVIIADGYFFYKIVREIQDENLIFEILMRARLYSPKDIAKMKELKPSNLVEFIEADLEIHDQSGFINRNDIKTLLENYKKIKQITE